MSEDKSDSVESNSKALPDGSAISCFACGVRTELSGKIPGDKIKCSDCNVEITVPKPDIIKKLASFESFNELPNKKESSEKVVHKVFCYSCKGKIDVSDQPVGHRFDCPGCGTNLKVPPRDQDQTSEEDAGTVHEPVGKLKINCHTCGAKLDLTGEKPFKKVNCPACNAEFQIPKRFSHFLLEERLGENDNFAVYRALDLTLSREVCLKVMSQKLSEKKELVESFLAEAGKAALVNDPNVVPIYSSGEHEGCSYLVMQFMSALSLKPYLEKAKGILPVSSVLRVVKEAAKGLDAAQKEGISHHNVSMNNILLDRDGNIKVSDFSLDYTLYKLSGDKDDLLKFFDPQYISLEMVKDGENNLAGDIYSLGAVFYHLITGVPPFPGSSPESIIKERLERSPVAAKKVRSEIPDYVSGYIAKMMSENPKDRPENLAEVIDILQSFIDGKPKFTAPATQSVSEDDLKVSAVSASKSEEELKLASSDVTASANTDSSSAEQEIIEGAKKIPAIVYAIVAAIIVILAVILSMPSEPEEVGPKYATTKNVSVKQSAEQPVSQPVEKEPVQKPEPAVIEESVEKPALPQIAPAVKLAPTKEPQKSTGGGFPVQVSERPLPHGISFKAYAEEVLAYLDKHEGDAYDQEMHRIKFLRNVKPYLEKIAAVLPFKGQLYVRGRNPIPGSIISASEESLTIKPDAADQTLDLSWQQFDNKQFIEMMQYYIEIRKTQLADSTIAEGAIIRRDLGADYFRLALVSDWYKMSDDVQKYADLTLQFDPILEKQVKALLPSVSQ
ncbi:MAG: protein kinase [Lentisphaerales bacterium]|nr:protein kinase [Lentisphaerales bacterium]